MNKLRRQENGQMAILLVMVLPVVFLLFALPLDAGIWFLDHRIAQNQADAAALAAVQYLPATDTTPATAAANTWLVKNGSGPTERACLNYSDLNPVDGRYDTVEVCVRRESPSAFSGLAGLESIYIGASATTAVISGCASNDISLVLDNSGSINDAEHQVLQTAATALVDEICFSPDPFSPRLGISRFRGTSAPVHDMTVDPTSLKATINAIEQGGPDLGSGTNMLAGLAGGTAAYSTGLGDRAFAPNIMFFITDGNDTHDNSDADIALASLATGAEVFAIAVGDVSQSTLDAIATDPDADHAFSVVDFEDLVNSILQIIAEAVAVDGVALIE